MQLRGAEQNWRCYEQTSSFMCHYHNLQVTSLSLKRRFTLTMNNVFRELCSSPAYWQLILMSQTLWVSLVYPWLLYLRIDVHLMVIPDALLWLAGNVIIVRTTGSYRLKSDLRISLLRMKLRYKFLAACIHCSAAVLWKHKSFQLTQR